MARTRTTKKKTAKKSMSKSKSKIDELFGEEPKVKKGKPAPKAQGVDSVFQTAPGQESTDFPPVPDMRRGFETIVLDLFDSGFDVVEEFQAIKESLTVRDALTPASLQAAANRTEEMAERAFRLYVVAKVEYEHYVRTTEVVVAAIRDASVMHLEEQKAAKTRTKQITEADVQATCAQQWPEEWHDIQGRRDKAKAMLELLNNLALLAGSRCHTVSNMLKGGGRA